MSILIDYFVNNIISLVMGFLIFLIINKILNPRYKNGIIKFFMVIALFYVFNIIVYPEEVSGSLILFIGFFFIVLTMYRGSFLLKFSIVLILYPIAVSIGYLTEDFGFLIWRHVFDKNMTSLSQKLLHSSTLILRTLMWYFIYHSTKNWLSNVSRSLTSRMWIVLDAICLASFVSIITVIYKTTILTSYAAYPACIASILTSIGCCYLCNYIAKTMEADMKIQALQYQQSYYKEMEQNHQNIRRIRHDMQNQLNIIGTLLHNKEVEQAEQYFHHLSDEFTSATREFCKNSIVNAVLNAKYSLALQNEIECFFEVDMNEEIMIDDVSLCSLIANSLDNAIEANQKIRDISKRKLSLKARCHNGFFSYEITNAKENVITIKNDKLLTEKAEKSSHGLGVDNIKSIVTRYHGSFNISYTDTDFTLTVLIW